MPNVRYRIEANGLEELADEFRDLHGRLQPENIAQIYAKETRGAFLNNIISRVPGVRVLHISGNLRRGLRVFARGARVFITMAFYGIFVDRGTQHIRPRNFVRRGQEIGRARTIRRLDGRDF